MNRLNEILIGFTVGLIYLVWGAFLVGTCMWPIAEECISARWLLTFTGLPTSLLMLGLGGVDIVTLSIVAVVGAIQWGLVAVLIVALVRRRMQKRENKAPNNSLQLDAAEPRD